MILAIFMCLCSCLDPIDIDVSADNVPRLVVDGQLNNSGEKQEIRLSRSLSFGDRLFNPESGAMIQLCDLGLNICENYQEDEPGMYSLKPGITGPIIGHKYYIRIDLRDGNQYESVPQELPIYQSADSLYPQYESELVIGLNGVQSTRKVIKIYLDTPVDNSNGTVFLRWTYDEFYVFPGEICLCPLTPQSKTCYVSLLGNTQNVILFTSESIEKNHLTGINVATKNILPLREFKNRHYFNVYQYSINKEAFEYWTRVQRFISQAGTVFDQPPASIPGNVFNINNKEDIPLGYFEVASVDLIRTFIIPSEFKTNISEIDICSQFTRRNWPVECCDCRTLPRASLIRPDWIK